MSCLCALWKRVPVRLPSGSRHRPCQHKRRGKKRRLRATPILSVNMPGCAVQTMYLRMATDVFHPQQGHKVCELLCMRPRTAFGPCGSLGLRCARTLPLRGGCSSKPGTPFLSRDELFTTRTTGKANPTAFGPIAGFRQDLCAIVLRIDGGEITPKDPVKGLKVRASQIASGPL